MTKKPELELAFNANIKLGKMVKVGVTPKGYRVIYPIVGGTFSGPKIQGEVMEGGWDWPLFVQGQYYEVKANYMLQADDGTIINIDNFGKFYASKGEAVPFGFTSPQFEAPLGAHEWLNDGAYIGTLETVHDNGALVAVNIAVFKAV